jgi:hypothetical protein
MADEAKTFMVEDARLIFRNFSGKEGPYNREGERAFSVVLDPETAEKMLEDGWNVKFLQPREEDDGPTPYIEVAVSFKNRPPRVILITTNSRTQLSESSVEVMDWADIQTVDLISRGYEWTVNGKSGVKAYLQSLFATIREDPLEQKYKIHENPPTHED